MNKLNDTTEEYPVFICDDDKVQIEQINYFLGEAAIILSDNKINFNIKSATNYDMAVELLKNYKIVSGIYFLDIELNNGIQNKTGFDLAEYIKLRDEYAQIIFITSHADLSLMAFQRRLGAVDYIVKDIDSDKFKKRIVSTLEITLNNLRKTNYIKQLTFSYKIGRHIKNISLEDVIYITTTVTPHKLVLVTKFGKAQFIGSIQKYLQNNPLLRKISRSCIVNPENIVSIDLPHRRLQFINGDIENFSRNEIKEMENLIQQYNYTKEALAQKIRNSLF